MRRRLNDGVTATKNFWNGLTSDQNIGQNRPTVQTDEQRREEERRIEAARKAQEERARTLQISSPVEITIGYGT
ncbi:hypothetical protein, partial [Shewanella algae]|uniref:hypothetical protein n=1 Tax=Shewanella algae TaxID=38313 RepID=UPI00313E4261